MSDERKRQPGLFSIIGETSKDFAENTSIHGLKYIVKNELSINERIFWLVVVLAGVICATFMTNLLWERYSSNPTRTSIATTFAPSTSVPFPAITICSINRIIATKVDDFVAKLDMNPEKRKIIRRAFPQLLAYTNPSEVDYNITELNILQDVLQDNDFYDMRVIIKRISENCKEMLLKCHWEFETMDCFELFQENFTSEGLCCSFNYLPDQGKKLINVFEHNDFPRTKKRLFRATYTGAGSGLLLLLNTMPQSIQYSPLNLAGLKVLIHNSDDNPEVGSSTKVVSKGVETYLQILATKIVCSKNLKDLSVNQRKLLYPDEKSLKYFDKYLDTNCLVECEAINIYKFCDCVPFYLDFAGKPICNISKIPCLHRIETIEYLEFRTPCDCPSQCEDTNYDVILTSTTLYPNSSWSIAPFYENENITLENIILRIFFMRQTHTILLRDTITSTIYLLSSFGGVFSLFLGCSFITIVELIYYGIIRFSINFKILGRIETNNVRHNHPQQEKKPQISKANGGETKLYSIKLRNYGEYYE